MVELVGVMLADLDSQQQQPATSARHEPKLPDWFDGTRESDRITDKAPRPMPCIIITYDTNGTVNGKFGSLSYETAFRFRPCCISTFPTFMLEVREDRPSYNNDNDLVEFDLDDVCLSFCLCRPGLRAPLTICVRLATSASLSSSRQTHA